jgi:mRNA interferase RelE/StbE
MAYKLFFLPDARTEWDDLDGSIKKLFKNALKKRLETPQFPGAQLRAPLVDCYKIKLRGIGYRLVCLVRGADETPNIVVLTVGRRDGGIYEAAAAAFEAAPNQN